MIGSRQPQCNQQNQEPGFFVDLLRNRISTFLLKERSKPVSYKKNIYILPLMLTKKMKKKQSYGDLQRRKRETLNGNNNNNKKGTFSSLVTLCYQGYQERV